MRYAIRIPKPCSESWQDMTPENNGRHCAQCSKTVVDFSGWEPEDILRYIQDNGLVCGRFRKEQLNTPINADQFVSSVAYSSLSFHKKLAAIFLLAFGMIQMSCDTGTPANQHPYMAVAATDTTKKKDKIIMGKVAPQHPVKHHGVRKAEQLKSTPPDHNIMGGAMVEEVTERNYLQGDVLLEPAPKRDTTKKEKR